MVLQISFNQAKVEIHGDILRDPTDENQPIQS